MFGAVAACSNRIVGRARLSPNFFERWMSKPSVSPRLLRFLVALSLVACGTPAIAPPPRPPARPVAAAPVPAASAPMARFASDEVALPPFRLVGDDGRALALTAIDARATLSDPLATTELVLDFQGSNAAVDAALELALPRGAEIAKLVVERSSAGVRSPSVEAQLVERPATKASYDEVLGARTLPELGAAPSQIYVGKIDAHASVRVVVDYVEALGEGYRLPLRGLPELAATNVQVLGADGAVLAERHLGADAPGDDVLVPASRGKAPRGTGATGVRGAGIMLARVPIDIPAAPAPIVSPIFLCDTGATRSLDPGAARRALVAIVSKLPSETEITVASFDQEVVPIYRGRAGGLDAAALEALDRRRALGASDLAGALAWVGRAALSGQGLHHRLVVIGDGRASAGERSPAELTRIARELADHGIDRIDAVALDAPDAPLLSAITDDPALPFRGAVIAGESGADEIARKLGRVAAVRLDVVVLGAKAYWPTSIDGAVAGDDVVVVAEVGTGAVPVVRVGGTSVRPALHDVAGRGLPALLGRREIDAAMARSDLRPADRRAAVVAKALERHVEGPYTALSLDPSATSAMAKKIALAGASRAHDVDVFDAPPVAAVQTIDPLDASVAPSVRVESQAPEVAPEAPAEAEPAAPATAVDEPAGRLPQEIVQRTVRLNHGRFRGCYERALGKRPKLAGRVVVKFEIGADGRVSSARDDGSDVSSPELRDCVVAEFTKLEFPPPGDGKVSVRYPLVFSRDDAPPPPRHIVAVKQTAPPAPPPEPEPHFDPPYDGPFARVMDAVEHGRRDEALALALELRKSSPADPLAWLAVGEAGEVAGDADLAARAYGSIYALWPYRADLVRTAGERLGRVGSESALRIARDAFEVARDERPDQPSSHRFLAFAEVRVGRAEAAFRVLEQALLESHRNDRFVGARPVLAADRGLIGAVFARSAPERRAEIDRRTKAAGGRIENEPSMRAVLYWETNASDVDLHVDDPSGDHASRKKRGLSSGGELAANLVDGYGPELFQAPSSPDRRAYPYSFRAVLPARGSMGFAPGVLEVIEHDGKGHLLFADKPFVVMNGHPGVEIGDVGPLFR
jgi:hypothetical protein